MPALAYSIKKKLALEILRFCTVEIIDKWKVRLWAWRAETLDCEIWLWLCVARVTILAASCPCLRITLARSIFWYFWYFHRIRLSHHSCGAVSLFAHHVLSKRNFLIFLQYFPKSPTLRHLVLICASQFQEEVFSDTLSVAILTTPCPQILECFHTSPIQKYSINSFIAIDGHKCMFYFARQHVMFYYRKHSTTRKINHTQYRLPIKEQYHLGDPDYLQSYRYRVSQKKVSFWNFRPTNPYDYSGPLWTLVRDCIVPFG